MEPVPGASASPCLAASHRAGLELGDAEVTALDGPMGKASRPPNWAFVAHDASYRPTEGLNGCVSAQSVFMVRRGINR